VFVTARGYLTKDAGEGIHRLSVYCNNTAGPEANATLAENLRFEVYQDGKRTYEPVAGNLDLVYNVSPMIPVWWMNKVRKAS
jgi:hypothetical protein